MDLSFTEEWLPGPSKTEFFARTYGPSDPRAVVVFIHGLANHIGRFNELYQLVTRQGIAVFAFDQRGYGLTGQGRKEKSRGSPSMYGKTTWKDQMRDIAWAVKHMKEKFENKPLFLMGCSSVSYPDIWLYRMVTCENAREGQRSLASPHRMRGLLIDMPCLLFLESSLSTL